MRAIPQPNHISSRKMSVSAGICARDIGCMQPMMWQEYGKSNQISTSHFLLLLLLSYERNIDLRFEFIGYVVMRA